MSVCERAGCERRVFGKTVSSQLAPRDRLGWREGALHTSRPIISMKEPLFRTTIPIAPTAPALAHHDPLFFLGSCFSENVGGRLRDAGHDCSINPLGTLFNPASLARTIELLESGETYEASDLRFCKRQQLYYSFDVGTLHAHEDRDACAASINSALASGRAALSKSSALFLTLGSAWAYVHRDSGNIVANCHKQPQDEFDRRLLSVDEAEAQVVRAMEAAAKLAGPSLRKIVCTVSPVRHWREGPVESSRSQAVLLTAAHGACDSSSSRSYFPSYEIVMDELRDYRWYERDLLHPSDEAVDYITNRLLAAHFGRGDDELRSAVGAVKAAAKHRHARPQGAAAKAFAATQLERCYALEKENPHIELEEEVATFESLVWGGGEEMVGEEKEEEEGIGWKEAVGCDISDEVEEEVRDAYDALKKKAGAFEALPKEAQARMLREACVS